MPKVVQGEPGSFVIQHSPPMGDLALTGFATVHANLLGTSRDGGQIIRYDIRGG
jgi:hypothetical protein